MSTAANFIAKWSRHGCDLKEVESRRRFNRKDGISNVTRAMTVKEDDSNEKPTLKEKLKRTAKEYGSTVLVFHTTFSLLVLGACYVLISSGVDMVRVLTFLHISEGTITKLVSSNAGAFVLAYAVYKIFAPVRFGITLTATPFIVRFLRRKGILKQKPNSTTLSKVENGISTVSSPQETSTSAGV